MRGVMRGRSLSHIGVPEGRTLAAFLFAIPLIALK